MELEIIKIATSQGIWAVLSIFLIFFILRNQEKRDVIQSEREGKYQLIISTLSDKLDSLNEIKTDIAEIKSRIKSF